MTEQPFPDLCSQPASQCVEWQHQQHNQSGTAQVVQCKGDGQNAGRAFYAIGRILVTDERFPEPRIVVGEHSQ
ncbi:hypothetical protein D3C75_1193580 [compost metagenome]